MRNRSLPNFQAPMLAILIGLPASAPAAAMTDSPPACPGTPTRVVHSVGVPTEYRGVYPSVPDLCYVIHGDDRGYFYFGSWKIDWPGAGSAYPAMKTAIVGPKGTRTSFVTRALPGLQWIDSFTNEGVEDLTVGARPYHTLKLAHEREGIEGNTYHSIITVWRDVATGVALKVVEDQIAGQSYGPTTTWEAVRVESVP